MTVYRTQATTAAAFTVICALELARYGVTVNAVAPNALTRMTENKAFLTMQKAVPKLALVPPGRAGSP